MNDEKRNEKLICEFVEASKKLKTPDELRDSNRKYIKEALNSVSFEKRKSKGWFRKKLSISYPVAAGFLLIFFLLLAFGFVNLTSYFKTSEPQTFTIITSTNTSDDNVQPYYSEHNIYVAGIGYVEKNINYTYFKENDNEGI